MCGINAIRSLKGAPVPLKDIQKMSSAIRHRGPDGAAYAQLDQGRLAFGFLRLSFVDLPTGQQPMFNEDGSICLIYNGEIYDHRELRRELIDRGHVFRTHSDSEVIIHLYEEYGLNFLERLNGEFAFLIWDARKNELLAVKDRFGTKPLFYAQFKDEVVFSSEMKGILALQRKQPRMTSRYALGPVMGALDSALTPFEGIRCLKPGHYLRVVDSQVLPEVRYWSPQIAINTQRSYEDSAEQLRHLLKRGVDRRMMADVPVGLFLSGGVDSASVGALMARSSVRASGQVLKAFTVSFDDPRADESGTAAQVSRELGLELHTVHCSADDLAGQLLKTVFHTESPTNQVAPVAKTFLSKIARANGVKAVLNGEGSDELLGGYAYFKLEQIWRRWQQGGADERIAKKAWKEFQRVEYRSEATLWQKKLKWQKTEAVYGFPSFHHLRALMSEEFYPQFLSSSVLKDSGGLSPFGIFQEEISIEDSKGLAPFDVTRLISKSVLSNYIIPNLCDRAEMANSIEGRTPFLDLDLVEFAYTLPENFCSDLETFREKRILRDALKQDLPRCLDNQVKHPFMAPNWKQIFATPTGRELFNDLLSPHVLKNAGIFNPAYIGKLKAAWRLLPKGHGLGKNLDHILGFVLSVQAMHRLFVETPIPVDETFTMENRSWS